MPLICLQGMSVVGAVNSFDARSHASPDDQDAEINSILSHLIGEKNRVFAIAHVSNGPQRVAPRIDQEAEGRVCHSGRADAITRLASSPRSPLTSTMPTGRPIRSDRST